ncbi:serpentine type 7TM GPCR chemoreceptor srh domain-containing protein [Ditylenchus destructor]|uniref:Serpentine type 7TM GPCR chemoreceptor srh domain-containing protein n=1 Tax=Ditylenchus destructor TaxID=166010 RepID=A0AAD4QTU8_9BILA|nr:serpentine type 7TM GPCR chemoreceptor srh domain-containing protein [Ditylenchus destructor]
MDQYLELLKLSRPYRVILVANALISTVLYPYLLYLFFTRTPKEISTCMRFYIINATTTCYALGVMLAIWQPVAVVPLLAGYSAGPLRLIGDWINIYAYEVTVALILNLVHAYTIAYLLYYAALRPTSKVATWMGSPRKTALYYTVQTLTVISLTVFLIHYMHNTPEQFGEMLADLPSSEFKALLSATAQRESTFASYSHAKWTKGWGVVYIGFFMGIIASELLIITVMILKTAKEIQLTRKIVRPSTHLVQMMIFRIFLLKSVFFLVFFLVPLSIIQLSLAGLFRSTCAPFVMYSMFSLHTPLIYLQLTCVIRSYRQFTWALLMRTFSFLRCVKYNESFGEEHPEQMSDHMSQRMSSVMVTSIRSARIVESAKVHPINSNNSLNETNELKPIR